MGNPAAAKLSCCERRSPRRASARPVDGAWPLPWKAAVIAAVLAGCGSAETEAAMGGGGAAGVGSDGAGAVGGTGAGDGGRADAGIDSGSEAGADGGNGYRPAWLIHMGGSITHRASAYDLNAKTPQRIALHNDVYPGNWDPITQTQRALAFSPDRRTLLVAGKPMQVVDLSAGVQNPPVTVTSELALKATWHPDNRRIAYVSIDKEQLFITDTVQLTTQPVTISVAVKPNSVQRWSPNGEWLSFIGDSGHYVTRATSSQSITKLGGKADSNIHSARSQSFTSDSAWLVVHDIAKQELLGYRLGNNAPVGPVLLSLPASLQTISQWSLVGDALVYRTLSGSKGALYIATRTGAGFTSPEKVGETTHEYRASPNGRLVAYRSPGSLLMVLDRKTGTTSQFDLGHPRRWSADSRWLAFSSSGPSGAVVGLIDFDAPVPKPTALPLASAGVPSHAFAGSRYFIYLAAVDDSNKLDAHFVDLAEPKLSSSKLNSTPALGGGYTALAVSSTGAHVAYGRVGAVSFHDTSSSPVGPQQNILVPDPMASDIALLLQ